MQVWRLGIPQRMRDVGGMQDWTKLTVTASSPHKGTPLFHQGTNKITIITKICFCIYPGRPGKFPKTSLILHHSILHFTVSVFHDWVHSGIGEQYEYLFSFEPDMGQVQKLPPSQQKSLQLHKPNQTRKWHSHSKGESHIICCNKRI